MKQTPFYLIMNKLYKMSSLEYEKYIQKNILQTLWFKNAIKNKQLQIKFLDRKNNTSKYLYIYFKYTEEPFQNRVKLININLKNTTIFQIKTLLQKLQKTYIITKNKTDLRLIDRKYFIKLYKRDFPNCYIDLSVLSRVLKYQNLSHLLPKKSELYYFYIKDILQNDPTLNDTQVTKKLFEQFKISSNSRTICRIRNKYLISSIYTRDQISYKANEKYFSEKSLLSKEKIKKTIPSSSGIYELINQNKTIYIGSTKNLKNRLYNYASNNAHTQIIKHYIQNNTIEVRFIKTNLYKKYEKIFLEDFEDFCGSLPLLNQQRILKI